MSITYEVIVWNNFGCTPHYGEAPSATTIAEAVRNRKGPADDIVAVEDGVMRPLTAVEESQLRSALGHNSGWLLPVRETRPELDLEELKRRWEIICRR
jgi:hypothetical protein